MTDIGQIEIAGRPIGPDHPPYVIAELSGNHNGSLDRALAILEAAAESGADAVKLQTYTADTMTIDHDGPGFVVEGGLWDGRRLYELYEEAHTPWDWHEALFKRGRELGVAVFSSPFDASAVDFLEDLGAPAFKIASFEIVDLPLIAKAASKGKPLIISTGLANLGEIADAVEIARNHGADEIVLLHCVSAYPAKPEEANLRTIEHLGRAFGLPVGLSDHTMGTAVSIAATTLGAQAIEKHVTLRRADGGVDSAFSLEPEELAELVQATRTAFAALGGVNYSLTEGERGSRAFRRSLYVVRDVAAGEELTAANIRAIRPGAGLPPKWLPDVLGKRATRPLHRGEPLTFDMVGPS